MRIDGYRRIADYAAIGNCETAALVALDGSIDWACLPDFDSPSVFAAILDPVRGGRFAVGPPNGRDGRQRYLDATNVLETTWDGPHGRLELIDWMPLAGNLDDPAAARSVPEIRRRLRAIGGPADVVVEWAPRPDYARAEARVQRADGLVVVEHPAGGAWLAGLPASAAVRVEDGPGGPIVRATWRLEPGTEATVATGLVGDRGADGRTHRPGPLADAPSLEETIGAWREWVDKEDAHDRGWAAPNERLVRRSELALKLLTYRPTGAIVAASTASLPEEIGGVRNWDYRFTWIRDASLTVQALHAVGHGREARDFIEWAERVAEQDENGGVVRIMYDVRGGTDLDEFELDHLAGYRHSRPVHIGNGAAGQRQLDVLGELLDGAYELLREGHPLSPDVRRFLVRVADRACEAVGMADDGLWEMRDRRDHYTYSQLMVWVGLDRAIRMAEHLPGGDPERWREARKRAKRLVLQRGWDEAQGSFIQRFGQPALDATNLLIPLHELLPFEDPRVQSTIDCTLRELTENGLVYRYRADDGLPGKEGAFVLCTFWLVDALALSGRLDEAKEIYDGVCARANHVGLFSEQIDPRSGQFLGNTPQAFSHLGLLNSTLYLAHAEGRRTPVHAPLGSERHREDAREDREEDEPVAS
jgi:GH15 family glucan-1,4-alpha-glucosidase